MTSLSWEAAAEAGVAVDGSTSKGVVGFFEEGVHAGVVGELGIGELRLKNVPVLVAERGSIPFATLGLQVLLGVDLMHHLCFTLDYPQETLAVSALESAGETAAADPVWDTPLWTFPELTLAQGVFSESRLARVLIDTGNYAGAPWQHRPGRRATSRATRRGRNSTRSSTSSAGRSAA